MEETKVLRELTPAQRVALAAEMLDATEDDSRFRKLLLADREAFRPHADRVLAWDDARLGQLRDSDFREYWKVARGASDAAVDAVADTVRAHLAELEKDSSSPNRWRTQLLAGVDTERARARLADLARQSALVARECRELHLEVPAAGPIVRRFVPDSLDVNAYEVEEGEVVHSSGLAFPLEAAEYLPENRGWTCLSPAAHVLTARLSLLPGDPLAASRLETQHWFLASGEECCDESTAGVSFAYRVRRDSAEKVELIANLPDAQPAGAKWAWNTDEATRAAGCCYEANGEVRPPKTRHRLVVEPFRGKPGFPDRWVGRLGGTALWLQQAEVPDCPVCGRLMFFVGQIDTWSVRGDVIDSVLFAFHCEDCGVGSQVIQIT